MNVRFCPIEYAAIMARHTPAVAMEKPKQTAPLLRCGNFGTHTNRNPGGTFSFVGSVHKNLKRGPYVDEAAAVAAFVAWFKSEPAEFQREHIGNVRNDIFKLIIEA